MADSGIVDKAQIVAVSVPHDGSGIQVDVSGAEPPDDLKAEISRIAQVNLDDVRYSEYVEATVPLATRSNDSSPWKGGARIRLGGELCSTAFAVLDGVRGYLLSAAHCRDSTSFAALDGAGQSIAPATAIKSKPSIDSLSIDPSASPATTARVYTGAWNSSTTAAVKGWKSNWKGDTVCISGGTSGQRCGKIEIDAKMVTGLTGGFYVEARAASGATMVAGGDSGGAVYRQISGGVEARGVIHGGAGYVSCGSHNPDIDPEDDPFTKCYWTLTYVPISVVLSTWGYTLEVG